MFGEQIETDSLIQEKENLLKQAQEILKNIDINKYDLNSGEFSIKKAVDQIKDNLRKSWSEREKSIRKSTSANVTDNVVTQISSTPKHNTPAYSTRLQQFNKKLKEFTMIDSNQETLETFEIDIISTNKYAMLKKLLKIGISKPGGTSIEDKLLELITLGKQSMVMDSYDHFSKSESQCPYCMQEVSNEHKEMLLKSIRKILNEDVENHIEELQKHKEMLNLIEVNVDYLREYKNELIINFTDNLRSYNDLILKLRKDVSRKIENPFDPIDIDYPIAELIEDLNNVYKSIIEFIQSFNKSIDLYDDTKEKLFLENKILARLEIEDTLSTYKHLLEKQEEDKNLLAKTNSEISSFRKEINELNSKKISVDIALQDINKNLHQIFSGRNRLSLELDENSNYRVKSRGKIIKLKKLSTGERNVITLCYFFAQLRNNTNAFEQFSSPYYIVLDDPISSLDFDNKIGIYAYLRKVLGEILANNRKSNILVLTHDLEVVFRLNNVFDDIKKELDVKKIDCYMRILSNKETEQVKDIKNMNNYSWNLDIIYDYAISSADDTNINDYYIGNVLRKTLEAYATFNYKKGISGLTQSEMILSKIKDEELKEHYKNKMLRLLLHSESHTQEAVKAIIDHESFEQFSKEERIQVSRDVLSLLYLLDKEHIMSYLDDDLKINNIEEWIKNSKYID